MLLTSHFLIAQNPIITDVFTADPTPLVYEDTVYLYTSHDTASLSSTNYEMKDWLVGFLFNQHDALHQSWSNAFTKKVFLGNWR
ncbi:hypothetical protein [Zunongwangia endophytica]|uniref:Uncharacterized protein n=1 Tax=Zunongwangia endophytica TaxID=1808945 RepID=A0ABV8H587_9FLAO|nr:hypothetical protein [Zunongwangia endophytica]MDN3594420.1 hypothetical protein [Zunongwangia endophytica]